MKNASTHAKLLAVAFILGFGWGAGRVGARDIPPFTAGLGRYIFAVGCFFFFFFSTKKRGSPP